LQTFASRGQYPSTCLEDIWLGYVSIAKGEHNMLNMRLIYAALGVGEDNRHIFTLDSEQ
jgi:hypothetical protein